MSRIGLLQMDPTVGDLHNNSERLAGLAKLAEKEGAAIGVSTELAVCGYPPRDLLLENDFIRRSLNTALSLESSLPLLVGTPLPAEDERALPTNGVVRCGPDSGSITGERGGRIVARKQLLPTYDVSDEARYFAPDHRSGLARSIGHPTLGVTVCEDAWQSAGKRHHPMLKIPLSTSPNGAVKAWTFRPQSTFQPPRFTVRKPTRGSKLLVMQPLCSIIPSSLRTKLAAMTTFCLMGGVW